MEGTIRDAGDHHDILERVEATARLARFDDLSSERLTDAFDDREFLPGRVIQVDREHFARSGRAGVTLVDRGRNSTGEHDCAQDEPKRQ